MRIEIVILLLSMELVRLNETDENKTFIPTKEWKVIKEGQSIPPGLHVRINLQTGKKEAKLLNSDERSSEETSVLAISTELNDDTTQDNRETSYLRHKEALKNIPDEGLAYSEEKLKELKKKFKSYENMKQEFADMNMQIKTDFEILSDLFAKYDVIKAKSPIRLDELNPLFEDLEYLLHQIDNANDFISFGGLEKIILPNLNNQTVSELKIHSIKLVGTLMQNNPKGQIAAFEKNIGSFLLLLLSQANSSNTNELSAILFALGGLIRKFPLAQEELLNKPGLKILIDLLSKHVDYKIKIKCLLLLTDLIHDCDEVTDSDVNKIKQCVTIDMRDRLSQTEYCTMMDELLNMHRPDYLESLYSAEDILNVLITSKDICQPVWVESPIFRYSLLVIKSNYEQMKGNVVRDELSDVIDKIRDLHEFLFSDTAIKHEL